MKNKIKGGAIISLPNELFNTDIIAEFIENYYENDAKNSTLVAIEANPREGKSPDIIAIRPDKINEYNSKGYGIYFSVNPTIKSMNKKPLKNDIKYVKYLHVDIDPDPNGKYCDTRRKEILKIAEDEECTFAIDSGNGIGLFWKLDREVTLENAEAMNRGLIKKYGGDVGTHNVDRIMRLPFTMNYPNKKKISKGYSSDPVAATLIKYQNIVFSPDEFECVEPKQDVQDTESNATVKLTKDEIKQIIDDIELSNSDDMSEIDFAFFCDYIKTRKLKDPKFIPSIVHMRDVLKHKGMYELREVKSPDNQDKYKRDDYIKRTIHKALAEVGEEGFEEIDKSNKVLTTSNPLIKLKAATMNDKRKKELKEMRFLADGLIPEKHHVFIFGASGAGKTTISHSIAKEIAQNNEDKEVLFLYLDGSPDIAVKMDDDIHTNNLQDRYKIVYELSGIEILNLLQEIIKSDVDLNNYVFILDTFKYISKNVNDKTANVKALHMVKDLCKLGVTFITLGHTNKDGKANSGTAEIEQDSDDLLRVDSMISEEGCKSSITKGGRVRMNFEPRTYCYIAGDPSSCRREDDFVAIDAKSLVEREKNEKENEHIDKIKKYIGEKKLKKDVLDFLQYSENIGIHKARKLIQRKIGTEWLEYKEDKKVYLIPLDF